MTSGNDRTRLTPPTSPRARVQHRRGLVAAGLRGIGPFLAGLVVIAVIWVALRGFDTGPFVIVERCTATANDTSFSLTPEQTENAALMTSIATERGLPARAATIAIATAIQESDLRNIDYGDRDSVGLFQQRPSQGWGTVQQIMNRQYAINAFYDELVKIDGYETMVITEAAQKVQRSGFPEAYADHEPEGRVFASALTGYSEEALVCRLKSAEPEDLEDLGQRMTAVAKGLPYGAGGRSTINVEAGTLTIDVGTEQHKVWRMAQHAVAHADSWHVVRVDTPTHSWQRDDNPGAWSATTNASTVTLHFLK